MVPSLPMTSRDSDEWVEIPGTSDSVTGPFPRAGSPTVPLAGGGALPQHCEVFVRSASRHRVRISVELEVVDEELRVTGVTQRAHLSADSPPGRLDLADLRASDFATVRATWLEAARELAISVGRLFGTPVVADPVLLAPRGEPTATEMEQIAKLRDQGWSYRAIANEVHRSKSAVERYYKRWKSGQHGGET